MAATLLARDYVFTDGYYEYYYGPWYYIKWALGAFLILVAFFIAFAYIHAHRRLKKGRQPLAYHRWLVRRRSRHPEAFSSNVQPMYPYPQQQPYGQQQDAYYAPPPPAYHQYSQQQGFTGGPPDGSKIDHTQAGPQTYQQQPTYPQPNYQQPNYQQPHVQGEGSTYRP